MLQFGIKLRGKARTIICQVHPNGNFLASLQKKEKKTKTKDPYGKYRLLETIRIPLQIIYFSESGICFALK